MRARDVLAVTIYTPIWILTALVVDVVVSLLGRSQPISPALNVTFVCVLSVIYFVPSVFSGWLASNRPALLGAAGVVFHNFLLLILGEILIYLLQDVDGSFLIWTTIPMLFLGAMGGYFGGKLRDDLNS